EFFGASITEAIELPQHQAGKELPEREIMAGELTGIFGEHAPAQMIGGIQHRPWRSRCFHPASCSDAMDRALPNMRRTSGIETEPDANLYLVNRSIFNVDGELETPRILFAIYGGYVPGDCVLAIIKPIRNGHDQLLRIVIGRVCVPVIHFVPLAIFHLNTPAQRIDRVAEPQLNFRRWNINLRTRLRIRALHRWVARQRELRDRHRHTA